MTAHSVTPSMRLVAATACACFACVAAAAPLYISADFSAGLNSVTSSMKARLAATRVTGYVIYDSSLPVPSSGTVNVFSIGAIPSVSDDLSFHFGDAGIQGGPAIQYRNGNYNGFFFAEDFTSPSQALLRLNVQGPSFSLIRLSDRTTLFSGTIGADLTNLQPYDPANPGSVPDPTPLALLAAGMVGLGLRRRKGAAAADE